MALHSAAGDGAVEHAEDGERGSDAMQLVVERHGLTAPWVGRQAGLGAIERFEPSFFIDDRFTAWVGAST